MDDKILKKELIIGFFYFLFGLIGLICLVVYVYKFSNASNNMTTFQSIGLVVLLVYAVIWVAFLFIHASSKKGKEFYKKLVIYEQKRKIK